MVPRLSVALPSLFLVSVALTGSLGPAAAPMHAAPDLAGSVAFAKQATAWQAKTLGMSLPATVPSPSHALPSQAVLALAARHGVTPNAAQSAQIAALDLLPAAKAAALTRVIDAFLGVEDATALTYAHADLGKLQQFFEGSSHAAPVDAKGAGIDFGPAFTARNQLLDASLALAGAWGSPAPTPASAAPPTLDLCPAIAVDTAGVDTLYGADCFLVVDVAGNDAYQNNAGGTGATPSGASCSLLVKSAADALIDLTGNDAYGNGRSCGANGAGTLGTGFLLDGSGDDTYSGGVWGVNAGGIYGTGFLLDQSGNDRYTAADIATNGGGDGGAGLLIDVAGDDVYAAGDSETNGAGGVGTGALIDLEGNDSYTAGTNHVNGGGFDGVGLLLDAGGFDSFQEDAGSCADSAAVTGCTVAPKGTVGAQLDEDLSPVFGLAPACSDGVDNDNDGRVDYRPAALGGGDPGCTNPFDNDEA